MDDSQVKHQSTNYRMMYKILITYKTQNGVIYYLKVHINEISKKLTNFSFTVVGVMGKTRFVWEVFRVFSCTTNLDAGYYMTVSFCMLNITYLKNKNVIFHKGGLSFVYTHSSRQVSSYTL